MITKELIQKGYDAGVINLMMSPNGDGVVCGIGDNWFYFTGLPREVWDSVEECKKQVPKAEITRLIYESLDEFQKEPDLKKEYEYYESYLRSHGIQERKRGIYDKHMLPETPIPGHRGYYPVCNKKEWEDLPDLYKVMEWEPLPDPMNHDKPSYVKAVIFSVTHMMPYGINAEVSVHPSHVQSILFSLHKHPECHLYNVTGVELQSGSRLPAKWRQDTTTGAFAILCCDRYVGKQGGYTGFVPDCIRQREDGTYKFDSSVVYNQPVGKRKKITHFEYSNPFQDEPDRSERKPLTPSQQTQKRETNAEEKGDDQKETLDLSGVIFYPIGSTGKFEADLSTCEYFMNAMDHHCQFRLTHEQYESVENIIIYCTYDAVKDFITVDGTFDYRKDGVRTEETSTFMLLPKTKKALVDAAEAQFQQEYGQSCLEYLTGHSSGEGHPEKDSGQLRPLSEQIKGAASRVSESAAGAATKEWDK